LRHSLGRCQSAIERATAAHSASAVTDGTARYEIELSPDICGKLDYRIRAYPHHPRLTHRFEVGLMRWL